MHRSLSTVLVVSKQDVRCDSFSDMLVWSSFSKSSDSMPKHWAKQSRHVGAMAGGKLSQTKLLSAMKIRQCRTSGNARLVKGGVTTPVCHAQCGWGLSCLCGPVSDLIAVSLLNSAYRWPEAEFFPCCLNHVKHLSLSLSGEISAECS